MTRWPREDWTDALWADASLKPMQLVVALAFARAARDREVTSASEAQLQQLTNASRDAVRRARDGLVSAGWLVLVSEARQQYATRYRMAVPVQPTASRTSETSRTSTSEATQTHVSRTSGEPDAWLPVVSDVRETTPDVRETYTLVLELEEPPPTSRADAVEALWLVVVGSLPQPLSDQLTRTSRIRDALGRHHDEGWSPQALATAAQARDWTGAGPGAVSAWLVDLPAPGTTRLPSRTPARPDWCGQCDESTRQREDDNGNPAGRCPACHPDPHRLAS